MIFLIVPENAEILNWTSIFSTVKRRIVRSYRNPYKIFFYKITINDSNEEFSLTKFKLRKETDFLKFIGIEKFNLNYDTFKKLLFNIPKESVCIIDSKDFSFVSRFMDQNINIEFYQTKDDDTRFQLIETSIKPDDSWEENKSAYLNKEDNNYEIHSIHPIRR